MKKALFILTLLFLFSSFMTVGAMAFEGENAKKAEQSTFENVEKDDTGAVEEEKEETIYEILLDNLAGIFSILTFVISIILTFFCKKGVEGDTSSVKAVEEHAKNAVEAIEIKMQSAECIISAFALAINEIDEKIVEMREKYGCENSTVARIKSEVDELLGIFTKGALSDMKADELKEKLDGIKRSLDEIGIL